MVDYAELHCLSNFSFLRGASHPQELVARAAELGYAALAITDECSLAGIVRAWEAAKTHGLHLVVGSEFRLADGPSVVLLARNREDYASLCGLITRGRRAAGKGGYHLERADLEQHSGGCLALWLPGAQPDTSEADWFARWFAGRGWIAVELTGDGDPRRPLAQLAALGERCGLPLVAAGDVHMHRRERRILQDAFTALRHRCSLAAAGRLLFASGERHLRAREVLMRWYPAALMAESVRIARACHFRLDELRYTYPGELVPAGHTPTSWLRRLVQQGVAWRWPQGVPERVCEQLDDELALIEALSFEPYFLTVHDLVAFARGRGILCQGRGSAANSAVCFCLGITEVDPAHSRLLFERFISRERGEPPDIDVDFEHQRREEVIQYIYAKYGRERAALAATVITYGPRSAIRDAGRVLGFSAAQIDALAGSMQWWDGRQVRPERLHEAGFDPQAPALRRLLYLVSEMLGCPRHLSQHVGGFVISEVSLDQLVPVENAAMAERTIIQWDKDDLQTLGLLKVDVLSLGMLSAIRRTFDLIRGYRGKRWQMAELPADDPAVYDMICRADTVGVFQIESRAQMAMLPRLRPRCFYDLVIEVAIVRPGPIQGDMVHPYLRQRARGGPVVYPDEAVRAVLERTLGIPIFQEQVMELAVVAAGFSRDEADSLRRAMAAWRRRGGLEPFEHKLRAGMRANGYSEEYAARLYRQICGFGEYGFPESHAASFALLVYVSAWLKCHEPAAFCAALLNSQPMGFYAPAQLVQDARRHGVEVRPVDVLHSEVECTLEAGADGAPAVRLGLSRIKGLSTQAAMQVVAARDGGALSSMADLVCRAGLEQRDLSRLAGAGALAQLSGHRHQARWAMAGVEQALPLAEGAPESPVTLAPPREGEDIVADYASVGLSLGRHPLALLRPRLAQLADSSMLPRLPDGKAVHVAGLVINRQRPGSAKGVTFATLEDEHGSINLILWPDHVERQRRAFLGARLLFVTGELQRRHGVIHVLAHELEDWSHLLGALVTTSRDFG